MATPVKTHFSALHHVKWEHCAAGVSGGVLSTLVLHPLDLVKIRFQVNEGVAAVGTSRPQYKGIVDALLTIGKTDGMRGLYQGVTPNVWGAGASWGLYFLFYNAIKQRKLDAHHASTLPALDHMTAASEAGLLTLVLTNPIWVAKTRLCLQYDALPGKAAVTKSQSRTYKGMADCLYKIYKYEGIKGLYRGFLPGMVGVSHGAVQFMTYEELKKLYNEYLQRPLDSKLGSSEYLVFAAISKIIAATITYPYQVVRSRLQDQHRSYSGAWDVIKQTWKHERIRGFYKGIGVYMIHVMPNICMVFLVYEHFTNRFGKKDSCGDDDNMYSTPSSLSRQPLQQLQGNSDSNNIHSSYNNTPRQQNQHGHTRDHIISSTSRENDDILDINPSVVVASPHTQPVGSEGISGRLYGEKEVLLSEDNDILRTIIEEDIS